MLRYLWECNMLRACCAEVPLQHVGAVHSLSVSGVCNPAVPKVLPAPGQPRQCGQVDGTRHLHRHTAGVPQELHAD